jgi:hypothetical protein
MSTTAVFLNIEKAFDETWQTIIGIRIFDSPKQVY